MTRIEIDSLIATLRNLLHDLVTVGYPLSNPLVLAISETLDAWIVTAQRYPA
ncbi:hypothetical protein [Sulfobacillus thermosulfidooxidans]|uniref:hypothetical protein n=1 Tax=Sulfobacillus thermosulfidooxidans TaxID=28034 RepID=UPI0002EBDE08|nr:hypothetical protein [Sulfobacillus thermosulfidooxidans]